MKDVADKGWMVYFKTSLSPVVRQQWYMLASHLNSIQLCDEKDRPIWKWAKSGKFSVRSVYEHLTKDEVGPAYKAIWRAKIPEKVRIFMWLIAQKAVLTKDNMIRKNWQGDPNCYFCGSIEIVEHLLFNCPIAMVVWGVVALSIHQKYMPNSYEQSDPWIKKALPGGEVVHMFGLAVICWSIWKARNMACFEKKLIKNPNEVIFSACLFMQFWAGLFKGDMYEKVKPGVDMLMKTALNVGRKSSTATGRRLISDGHVQDLDDGVIDQDAVA
jgi:hypothetical protein